jgi:hypothetical protein
MYKALLRVVLVAALSLSEGGTPTYENVLFVPVSGFVGAWVGYGIGWMVFRKRSAEVGA